MQMQIMSIEQLASPLSSGTLDSMAFSFPLTRYTHTHNDVHCILKLIIMAVFLSLFQIIPQGEEMVPAVLKFAEDLVANPLKK